MIHYGVSKTPDIAVARGLAKRMAGTGITVNSVLPGPTLSDGVEAMLAADERAKTGKPIERLRRISSRSTAEARSFNVRRASRKSPTLSHTWHRRWHPQRPARRCVWTEG
jgi:NAD(P)-dependent dehydrogenase (short-subunit alcohol dehydrogenase family)